MSGRKTRLGDENDGDGEFVHAEKLLMRLEKEGEAAEAQNASTCFLLIPLHIITAGSLTTLVLVIPCRNRCHFTAFERRTRGFTVPVLNAPRCTHVHLVSSMMLY